MSHYLNRLQGIPGPEDPAERERDALINMAARTPEALAELRADKVAQLENPKVVRPYHLVARSVDEWDDEQLLHATADLQGAAATRQLGWQARMTQHSSALWTHSPAPPTPRSRSS